jgi:hypothetical protein
MNEVSIIINGVRYDAVEAGSKSCSNCEFLGVCADFMSDVICYAFSLKDKIFKKSDKKFEV